MADLDFETVIENLSENPKAVTSPSGSVTQIAISEAIAADNHLAKKNMTTSMFTGLRRAVARGPRHYGT